MYEITSFTKKSANRGLFKSDMQDLYIASITDPETDEILNVSQWHDEDYWVIDSYFGKYGNPVWVHGEGERTTHPRTINLFTDIGKQLVAQRLEAEL